MSKQYIKGDIKIIRMIKRYDLGLNVNSVMEGKIRVKLKLQNQSKSSYKYFIRDKLAEDTDKRKAHISVIAAVELINTDINEAQWKLISNLITIYFN